MKQLILILLFIVLSSNISVADSTTVKICYKGEIGITFYSTIDKEINRYNSSGQLIQNETYNFEFYSYDQVDTAFRLVTRTDYGHNASGLIDTMLETQVNSLGTYYFRFNYLYDASGNLIEKLRFVGSTFPLDSNLRTIYQYDSNNNLILERDEEYVASQYFWTTNLFRWSYDLQDRNIEYRKINYQSNTPHDSLIDEYIYSASGKILSKEEFRFGSLVDSTYFDYEYDSNDSLIKHTDYENSIGNTWIPTRTYEYSYSGDSTIEMRLSCLDTTCSDTMIMYTIVHDFAGRIINNVRGEYDGYGYWDNTWGETHAYNGIGNIVDYFTYSNGGGGCSSNKHITYDYNLSDDLIHSYTHSYHCNDYYSDCYYYTIDSDSILVLIDYTDTICSNSFVPLAITVEGGIPPYQYDWTPGNYLSDSTILNPRITNFDTTLTYRLLITDAQGRTANDTMKLFGYHNLHVPLNIISFGVPCQLNSFHLTMDTIPLNYNFDWILPNNTYGYGDTIVAPSSGNYILFLTDSNGCRYPYQTDITLQPSISLGPDTTVCLNDTVILIAGNFAQYAWNTGDVSQSIEVYSSTPSVDTYSVYVTDINGCTNSDTISVSYVVCLGQDEIYAAGIRVTVYPKQILVELPPSLSHTEFTLTDISGRVIMNSVIHDHQSIDTSGLPAGVYVYRLENYSGKIVKE